MTNAIEIATDEEVAAFVATLTPAERETFDSEGAWGEASRAVAAATAELATARAVLAETSSPATRSALVRAQRQLAKAQEVEILAGERYRRAQAVSDADGPAEALVATAAALKLRIRAAVQAASTAVGLHAELARVASAAGLPQAGPPHRAALGEFAIAARALTARMDGEHWPTLASNRNRGGSDHV